ncbi:hypothetical protein [uncultured Pseudodesulfovibrio sp.]|uniref:hypothetical protein n=1 Tax=uncultured Pseudodesulfovibrio sp. TaxID=2035858 RepID=UPI0029C62D2A|nr:hypothetical protein [uncultured Pseudodesulfovibrio sp.]
MKKLIFLNVLAFGLVLATLSGNLLAAQPQKMNVQSVKPSMQVKTHVTQDAEKWHQAQIWLKSVGYDKTIEQMKAMTSLNLQKYSIEIQKQVTNENMRHVALLTNLEVLRLPGKIGDTGIQHIAGLLRLKTLNLPQSRITDEGMRHLKNLTQVDSLVLSASNISDAGVAQIKHLRPSVLNLTRTKITDAGVAMLNDMPLRLLFISFTAITDASVPVLSQHHGLERLDIQGRDGITQQGADQLKAALPNTRIVYP